MTKIKNMILILIIGLFTCKNSKSAETDHLLKQEDRYGICIPITVPVLSKTQRINGEFVKKHKVARIIPHIALLQANFTNDQLSEVKTYLTEYVKSKQSFEITMSPQIVAAENNIFWNNTFWDVDNTSEAWNKLQEIHLFLKERLPITLKSQINFIRNTHPHYRPHCPIAYNVQDESLNDQVNQDLAKVAPYLKFIPHFIWLVRIDSVGNIENILQHFHLQEDLTSLNKTLVHTHLLSDKNNSESGQILALFLKTHYLNKTQNASSKKSDSLAVAPSPETSSSEEE